jgi:peptide/nickel transport system ATP-binding protein
VTHDVGVAVEVADRIAVMYGGRIVELGPCSRVIRAPAHPYTQGLLMSRAGHGARKGGRLVAIPGSPPDLANLPPGCAFAPRCSQAIEACRKAMPDAVVIEPGHLARCLRAQPTAVFPERAQDQLTVAVGGAGTAESGGITVVPENRIRA